MKGTGEGATVVDPFVGGGSVAAAALMLGRKFVGIDLDRKHIETARRRVEVVVKELALTTIE
jgi:site-specific DNA-methyltransferase (adenine-specific)